MKEHFRANSVPPVKAISFIAFGMVDDNKLMMTMTKATSWLEMNLLTVKLVAATISVA